MESEPATMPNSLRVQYLINQIVSFPQSQRILVRIPSKVIYNGEVFIDKLQPELPTPLSGFEKCRASNRSGHVNL